jgi:hypothetical protein
MPTHSWSKETTYYMKCSLQVSPPNTQKKEEEEEEEEQCSEDTK